MEMIRHIKRVGIIGHFAEGLDMGGRPDREDSYGP